MRLLIVRYSETLNSQPHVNVGKSRPTCRFGAHIVFMSLPHEGRPTAEETTPVFSDLLLLDAEQRFMGLSPEPGAQSRNRNPKPKARSPKR